MADSAIAQRGLSVPILAIAGVIAAALALGEVALTQNVSSLGTRTATLEAAPSGPTTADVQTLKQGQADLAKRLEAISVPDVSGLAADVAALKTAAADQPKALSALEARVAAVESRPAPAPTDLTQINAALTQLQGDMSSLKARIEEVASTVPAAPATDAAQVAAELAALDGQVKDLATRVAAFSPETLTGLRGGLDALGAKVAAIDLGPTTAELGELKARVDAQDTQLAALPGKADLAALQSQLDAVAKSVSAPVDVQPLTTDISGLRARIDALDTQVAALPGRADLAALQSRLDDVAKSVPAAVDLQPLTADIGALKTRVDTIEAGGSADARTVTALGSEVAELTARLGKIESSNPTADVAAVRADLTSLTQEVSALPRSADVDDLKTRVAGLESKATTPPATPKVLARIYFGRGSFKLSDDDMQTLAALAAELAAQPREVSIMGFSDTQGPAEFNRALSLRRASAVRKALLGAGLDTSMVTSITGLGEDGPPVSTDDNAPERGNRTVLVLANN